MRGVIEVLGALRLLPTLAAIFAALFGALTTSDLNSFYSGYFAGAITMIALFIWLDEDDV